MRASLFRVGLTAGAALVAFRCVPDYTSRPTASADASVNVGGDATVDARIDVGSDAPACTEGLCVCPGGEECFKSCAGQGCAFTCSGSGACSFTCAGGACTATNSGSGQLSLYCLGGNCTAASTASGASIVYCNGKGNCTCNMVSAGPCTVVP
jgi:hypothetical protein